MENFFVILPRYGRIVSTVWKIISDFFHAMEELFPRCGRSMRLCERAEFRWHYIAVTFVVAGGCLVVRTD